MLPGKFSSRNPKLNKLLQQQIGLYQITEILSDEGTPWLCKGYHVDLQRPVAISIVPNYGVANGGALDEHFKERIRLLAALRHPHIAVVYDSFPHRDTYCLVTEYVTGETLAWHIARGNSLSPLKVQAIITQIAKALDYAHANAVVHGKITPTSIILTEDGQAVLTDFDVLVTSGDRSALSNNLPYYTAPELTTTGGAVTPASDIYSLGVVLFEMLTGTPPYVAESPAAVAARHVSDPVPNVRNFAPNTSAAVNTVLQTALAKSPQNRFTSAGALAKALAQAYAVPATTADSVEFLPTATSKTEHTVILPPTFPLDSAPNAPQQQQGPIHGGIAMGAITIILLMVLTVGVWLTVSQPHLSPASPTTHLAVSTTPSVAAQLAADTVTPLTPPPTLTPAQRASTPTSETATPTVAPTFTATATPIPTLTALFTVAALATDTAVPAIAPTIAPVAPTDTPTTEQLLAALHGKILFKTDRAGYVEIYQMDADGSEQAPLAPERAYLYNEAIRWETFSPNRRETIVVRGAGQPDLWRVNILNGDETRLTSNGAADYDPVWSPHGNQIVFVSERTGSGDLYLLDLEQGGFFRLTINEGDFDKHPSWSPEGTQIAFWSDRGNEKRRQIWRLDVESKVEVNLSNNASQDWDPVWVK